MAVGHNRGDRIVAPEDLEPRLLEREERGQRTDRFGLAEHKIAVPMQREGEALQHATLQVRGEIDQHIATQNEIDARKRRAVSEIVLAEHDKAANLLLDLEGAFKLHEMTF